jgi:hypothetical protein
MNGGFGDFVGYQPNGEPMPTEQPSGQFNGPPQAAVDDNMARLAAAKQRLQGALSQDPAAARAQAMNAAKQN